MLGISLTNSGGAMTWQYAYNQSEAANIMTASSIVKVHASVARGITITTTKKPTRMFFYPEKENIEHSTYLLRYVLCFFCKKSKKQSHAAFFSAY